MPPAQPSDPHAQALAPLRAQIDELDRKIVELLNQRASVVVEIGKLKQQNNTPIYRPIARKRSSRRFASSTRARCRIAVWRRSIAS